QADLAAVVDLEDLDEDFLAFLQVVRDFLYTLLRDLRDVHEAVFAGEDRDEGAEVDDLRDFAFVDLADFRFRANRLDHFEGFVARGCVFAVDPDVAVVVDVDRRAGGFGDAADRGAALADDF